MLVLGKSVDPRCQERFQWPIKDVNWKAKQFSVHGFPAQICQREMDHQEALSKDEGWSRDWAPFFLNSYGNFFS